MVNLQEIVRDIMNPDPAYYAGRGNMLVDLDSNKLTLISNRVYSEGGSKASSAFGKMVAELTDNGDMSATTFLTALDALIRNEWKYAPEIVPSKGSAIAGAIKDGDAPELMSLALAPSSPNVVPASRIAGDFLRAHGHGRAVSDRVEDMQVMGPHTARYRQSLVDLERHTDPETEPQATLGR